MAGNALLLIHVRDLGADVELRLGQHGGRPGGGGPRLSDVLVNCNFGEWASPQRKTPSVGKIHRP